MLVCIAIASSNFASQTSIKVNSKFNFLIKKSIYLPVKMLNDKFDINNCKKQKL